MLIENHKKMGKPIKTFKRGDCFETNGRFFMKLTEKNWAADLETGIIIDFSDDTLLFPVTAKIVIE